MLNLCPFVLLLLLAEFLFPGLSQTIAAYDRPAAHKGWNSSLSSRLQIVIYSVPVPH